jgi:hypothetical protein
MSFSLIICRSIWRGYHYNVMRPGRKDCESARVFATPTRAHPSATRGRRQGTAPRRERDLNSQSSEIRERGYFDKRTPLAKFFDRSILGRPGELDLGAHI